MAVEAAPVSVSVIRLFSRKRVGGLLLSRYLYTSSGSMADCARIQARSYSGADQDYLRCTFPSLW